jgi:hypothetical protein
LVKCGPVLAKASECWGPPGNGQAGVRGHGSRRVLPVRGVAGFSGENDKQTTTHGVHDARHVPAGTRRACTIPCSHGNRWGFKFQNLGVPA